MIQVLIIIPPIVFQYYSDRRMGMMRYLVYKKSTYSEGIFSPSLMNIYKVIFIASILYFIFLLIRNYRRSDQNFHMTAVIFGLIISFAGTIFLFSASMQDLLAYHFFLIAIFIQIILQYARAAFWGRN